MFHKQILFLKIFFIYNLLYISISQIERPLGIKTGYKTFRHIHNRKKRQRDTAKHFNQSVVCKLFLPTGTAALTDCLSYCNKILGVFLSQAQIIKSQKITYRRGSEFLDAASTMDM